MVLTEQERAILWGSSLLRGTDPALLDRLLVSEGAVLAPFSSGGRVYDPQHFRRALGILLEGQLQVTKGSLTVSLLEPGELFGAAALYSDSPEFATTITAVKDSRCLLLDQALVDRLLVAEGRVRENYLRYLTGRIRFLSGRLQSLSQPGAEGKLARYLLANGRDGSLTCPATDLAHRLGISRASLYRAFEALEGEHLIRREGKTIHIPDRSALEGAL